MSTRTERINWIAMHLIGELQMVASKDAYPTTVQALNTAVDGELATLKAERDELREALERLIVQAEHLLSDKNPAVLNACAVLAKGKA